MNAAAASDQDWQAKQEALNRHERIQNNVQELFQPDTDWRSECMSEQHVHLAAKYQTGIWNYIQLIRNALTEKECKQLVKISEIIGFERKYIDGFNAQYEALRVKYQSSKFGVLLPTIMEIISKRIEKFIPQRSGCNCRKSNPRINPKKTVAFVKYVEPGDCVTPHSDAFDQDSEYGEIGITGILYLTQGYKGGTTNFVSKDDAERISIKPKIGSILLFDRTMQHEAAELEDDGQKYILQFKVFYQF